MSFWERARAVKAMYKKAKRSPKYSIIQVDPYLQIRVPTDFMGHKILNTNGDQNAKPEGSEHRRASQAPHSSPDNSGAGSPQGPGGAQTGGRSNPYTSLSGGTVYTLAGQLTYSQLYGLQPQQYPNVFNSNSSVSQGLSQMSYMGQAAGVVGLGDAFTPDPEVAPGDLKVGEITAWRSWKVAYEPAGIRLRSLYWGALWTPGTPMTGRPWANTEGVYAWKNKDAAEEYGSMSLAGMPWENGTMIVHGQVDLWGVVDEYTSGYRAEYAAIKSLDAVLGERKFDELLDSLRKTYGVTG